MASNAVKTMKRKNQQ
jgi:hypothetical protein